MLCTRGEVESFSWHQPQDASSLLVWGKGESSWVRRARCVTSCGTRMNKGAAIAQPKLRYVIFCDVVYAIPITYSLERLEGSDVPRSRGHDD